MAERRLADLHLHMYGTIRPRHLLDYIVGREVAWEWYEAAMIEAYGACPPTQSIVERHGAGDAAAAAEFESVFVFGDADAGNFDRFQAKFNLLIAGSEFAALAWGDDTAFERLRAEVLFFLDAVREDQLTHGLGYAEQRLLVGGGVRDDNARSLVEDVLAVYDRRADDALTERLALSLPRGDPWSMWEHVQHLVLGGHGAALTGVDFCYIEEGHPPKDKAEFFDAVHAFNDAHPGRALSILYHVGESFRDKSLESSVRWVQEAAELGAHRLGHAIALGVDPGCYGEHTRTESGAERTDQIDYDLAHADGLARHGVVVDRAALAAERDRLALDDVVTHAYAADRLEEVRRRQDYAMERVIAAGSVVEVCPTSNRRIGDIADSAHHPVHRFLDRGVPVVVGSDDPGIFGVTLADELDWVVNAAGLDEAARHDLEANAWRYRSEVMTGRLPN